MRGKPYPGDPHFGDRLSAGGFGGPAAAARAADRLLGDRDAASRELSLGALQVWQALRERVNRKPAQDEVTLVFTDLVGFSSWALKAGDDATLKLLRNSRRSSSHHCWNSAARWSSGWATGSWPAFLTRSTAIAAVIIASEALKTVEVDGYTPTMRVGIHTGRPQRIGSDWLGVDVNIAARVMECAGKGGVLITGATLERLTPVQLDELGVSRETLAAAHIWPPAQRCATAHHDVPAGTSQRPVSVPIRRKTARRHRNSGIDGHANIVHPAPPARHRQLCRDVGGGRDTLLVLGPRVRDLVIRHVSTNLHNLGHGHLGTLIGSAFVTENGPIWVWLPGLVCLLALAELLWRSGRVLITFVLGHVGATLIVAAGLATAINVGWLPLSVARATDVGISYGAVAVLGALSAAIPSRWRPAWIGWWLSVGLLVVCAGVDFTDARALRCADAGDAAVASVRRRRPMDAAFASRCWWSAARSAT